MKNMQTKQNVQKLEAPVALTPDQIAMVAAGASLSIKNGGGTTTSGAQSGIKNIAFNSSVRIQVQ